MRYYFFDQLQKFIILNKMLDQFVHRSAVPTLMNSIKIARAAQAQQYNIHHVNTDFTRPIYSEDYEHNYSPTLARSFSTYNRLPNRYRRAAEPVQSQADLVRSTRLAQQVDEPSKL